MPILYAATKVRRRLSNPKAESVQRHVLGTPVCAPAPAPPVCPRPQLQPQAKASATANLFSLFPPGGGQSF